MMEWGSTFIVIELFQLSKFIRFSSFDGKWYLKSVSETIFMTKIFNLLICTNLIGFISS